MKTIRPLFVVACSLLGMASGTFAQEVTWISGTTNTFATGSAWSTGTVPGTTAVIAPKTTNPQNLQLVYGTNTSGTTTVAGIDFNNVNNWIINATTGTATVEFDITGTVSKAGAGAFTIKRSSPTLLNVSIGEMDVAAGGNMVFGSGHGTKLSSLNVTTTNLTGGNILIDSSDYSLGALTVSSGTLVLSNDDQDTNGETVSVSSLAGTGGTILGVSTSGTSMSRSEHVTLAVTQAVSTTAATILTNGNTGTSDILALSKAGVGSLTLTGSNSYTGGTTITAGTLVVANNSALGKGSATVSGGTLDLNGTTVQNLNIGTASFTLSSGTLAMNLDTAINFDSITSGVGGSLNISGGTLALSLTGGAMGFAGYASTYALFSGFGSFTGANAGGFFTALGITGYDTTDWFAHLSTGGVLSFTAATPEPGTLGLLGVGLLGLAFRARRRARLS